MKASILLNMGMNPAIAYIIGLCLPLYKEKMLRGNYYVIGAVNHNAGMITETELAQHFMSVSELITNYIGDDCDMLFYNKTPIYGTIQPKKGFSVILEKDINVEQVMLQKLDDISNSDDEIKSAFIKGCFDGRSSFDTTAHYLSIDVDRNHEKQDKIAGVIMSLKVDVNLNQRDINHPKNDQIRIHPSSLHRYCSYIGFYSTRRESIVKHYLESI